MVKTKLTVVALVLLCATSCYHYSWDHIVMDGSRTGVTVPDASNVDAALGTVTDGVYTAPNGTVFTEGATPKVAENLISVQPRMADLKSVIGHTTHEMSARRPESELSNWFVDHLMEDTEKITGRKVDVGIANFGGIRTSFPEGTIVKDDIVSMFPFINHLCYVALKGEDLQVVFDQFARRRLEMFGGAELVIKDRKVESLKIGGEPLDPEKVYGLATIDFLLDGGDSLFLAKNAKDLIITDKLIIDSMLPYVLETTAAGKPIEYSTDGRVVIEQ